MENLQPLIVDLALILGAAGIITIIFQKLKQPVVLGYILAGLLISPNFNLFPSVGNAESIRVWADIGVIFLLFSLGLEFSFKKLVKVVPSAGVAGIFECSMMLLIGYITGKLMGWSTMDCIFLGGIIAISSTTIIIKAFEELGLKTKKFAGTVFGILVIEDLVAVLLLVLLSTVAVSQNFSGSEMLFSILKLAFFLILWFVSGIYILPTFLKRVRKFLNEETVLVLSLGLCLIMVFLASKAGFSSALGAFIMGSILADTTENERIIELVKPVKSLFGAIFFVSVGMLINLSILADYIVPVLILTFVVIGGKIVNVSIGSLISGQPLKQSVQTGMSLAQIGEFSFIIATLGLTLEVTSPFLYPIAVGVSVLTTFCSPYLIKLSEPFYYWLEQHLPKKWVESINSYSSGSQKIRTSSSWRIIIRGYLKAVIINSVIIIGILLLIVNYVTPLLFAEVGDEATATIVNIIIEIVLIAPFLWAMAIRRIEKEAFKKLWNDRILNRGPLVLLDVLRYAIVIIIIGFLLSRAFSVTIALIVACVLIALLLFAFRNGLQFFYGKMENRFLTNLQGRVKEEEVSRNLIPWDGHLTDIIIPQESPCVGKSLMELDWRDHFGINVVLIERGNKIINVPGGTERIFPLDDIAVIGTDDELEAFNKIIIPTKEKKNESEDRASRQMELMQITIKQGSRLDGKDIKNSNIRQEMQGIVVGVERDGKRRLNPPSSYVFEEGDSVWIAGNKKRIKELLLKE